MKTLARAVPSYASSKKSDSMSRTIKNIISGSHNSTLLGAFAALFVVYSFLIGSTVVSINERKNLYSEIRAQQAHLAELEINYFALVQGVDLKRASAMGFADQSATFAYTNPGAEDAVALR